ncbi:protein UPSTREAM OF FLC-like [Quillaja saponaria]|uniref:Protein UPSTREAM OF FLC-like n=1 Tax=Quillaja saponaria TaxID=32244 RepID=A0AAD7Q6N2_QUISA|nr:protein UPSTREAM OF FLC-like [Quillaja saponaria]
MAVSSRGRNSKTKKFPERETSPERPTICIEPKPNVIELQVPVIYYLSRNGQLEHPHLMEVPVSSTQGLLYMKDVINRLIFLRGQGMVKMYSWSSKRSYKNGFVWQDLSEHDFIYPCNGNEYVLKGSSLLENSSSFRSYETMSPSTSKSSSKTNSSSSTDTSFPANAIINKMDHSRSRCDCQAYKAITTREFAAKAANASTQTEEKRRQREIDSEEALEKYEGDVIREISGEEGCLPFSNFSCGGGMKRLEGSMEVGGLAGNRDQMVGDDSPSGSMKASAVMMQLIRCGSSRGVKDCEPTVTRN